MIKLSASPLLKGIQLYKQAPKARTGASLLPGDIMRSLGSKAALKPMATTEPSMISGIGELPLDYIRSVLR
jgi:hypothetical protein